MKEETRKKKPREGPPQQQQPYELGRTISTFVKEITVTASTQTAASASQPTHTTRLDAVVIGAGIAGLYQLHKLREMGLKVKAYETGSGVGGTWYWNRYPGSR